MTPVDVLWQNTYSPRKGVSLVGRRPAAVVSATMRQVRSRDTSPERLLRKALWAQGLRYRLHSKRLPGHPDIVFPSPRVAVFVDGDFWHGNQWRVRGLSRLEDQFDGTPNAETYWVPKIRRNMERDAEANRRLKRMGWRVIRCWESEIKRDLNTCVRRIVRTLRRRRP